MREWTASTYAIKVTQGGTNWNISWASLRIVHVQCNACTTKHGRGVSAQAAHANGVSEMGWVKSIQRGTHLQQSTKPIFFNLSVFCKHQPFCRSIYHRNRLVIAKTLMKPKADMKNYNKNMAFCLLPCGKETQRSSQSCFLNNLTIVD